MSALVDCTRVSRLRPSGATLPGDVGAEELCRTQGKPPKETPRRTPTHPEQKRNTGLNPTVKTNHDQNPPPSAPLLGMAADLHLWLSSSSQEKSIKT